MAPSKSATALRNVLRSHKASEFKSGKDSGGAVIELDSTISPIEAANVLWKNNILGAPVWNEKDQKYVGFFDQRDILSAVTASAKECKLRGASVEAYNDIMVKSLEELKMPSTSASATSITVSYLAARNPFHSCAEDATLEEMGRTLSQQKCHRIPIVPSTGGHCTNIVSQSALVKFLSSHVTSSDLEETLDKAGLDYKKNVVSVLDTSAADEAFDLLDSHRLSGIAVVDEDGRLVGNTSARDIKLAASNKGHLAMDTDILSYLAAVRQATPVKNERYPSCHVHEKGCTVGHVVNLLAKTGYHRVFVVDEDVKPIGVISVADVIRFAIENGE